MGGWCIGRGGLWYKMPNTKLLKILEELKEEEDKKQRKKKRPWRMRKEKPLQYYSGWGRK